MFCINCGTKLPDGARFCFSCGSKIPVAEGAQIELNSQVDLKIETKAETTINSPTEVVEEPIKFVIHGEEFSVDGSYRNYIAERNRFHKAYYNYIDKIISEQFHTYREYINSDPDKCVEILSNLGSNAINWGLDSGINFLIEHKIFDVSKTVLSNECAEQMQGFYKTYIKFEEGYLSIIATEEQMEEYRKLKHESRGRWQGGGFGVAGAVKGAAVAGAFNLGGTILSSIGTAITGAMDNSIIRKEKREFLSKRNWFGDCLGALLSDISVIFQSTYHLLCQKTSCKMPPLDIQKANVYFENVQQATSPEQVIAITLMGLKEYPHHRWAHAKLIKSLPFLDMDVIRLVEYFQPEGFWISLFRIYERQIKEEFSHLPEDDYKQLDEKISYLQGKIDVILQRESESEFIAGFAKRYLGKWQKTCEELKIYRRTAEDGTVLSSVEELEAYQRELKRLNEYTERAKNETSADREQAIWIEAQQANFTFEPLLAKIKVGLEKSQEQQTQLLEKYIEGSKNGRYQSPVLALSYWRLVYLNLEEGVSANVRSAVKEHLVAAAKVYFGNESPLNPDKIESISKEEMFGMMLIIANGYNDREGYGEAYVANPNEKRFTNACKGIGGNNPDETPLILIDRSDFENGKRGFVLTDKRLYKNCEHEDKIRTSWKDFNSVENHSGNIILVGNGQEVCIDSSWFASHNQADMFLFQTFLRVIHAYKPVPANGNHASAKTVEDIQQFDKTVEKELNAYLKEAKGYTTPLEILSFWRIILLSTEQSAVPAICTFIENRISEASIAYNGNEKSGLIEHPKEISKEELLGMLSVIAKQYQKPSIRGNWPVYIAGTESFSKKSANAYKKIGGNNPDEIPLLILDESLFGNGKSGYVLTNKRLYANSHGGTCILWENIISLEYHDKGIYLISDGIEKRIDGSTSDEDDVRSKLFLLKTYHRIMQNYILEGEHSPTKGSDNTVGEKGTIQISEKASSRTDTILESKQELIRELVNILNYMKNTVS